jgi:Tfp pilus assembly PilM family ATPase
MFRPDRLPPPVRRVLAVDAGSRRLKLTLIKCSFGRVQILREESIDLHEEGLVTTDELKNHLQDLLEDCGRPPLALTLSQHLSTSQIIEVPLAPESEVRKLIEEETVKLGGVSDSTIVYDFVRVESSSPDRQQFWVTLGKERDIEERVKQLGLEHDDLCEVTTTANALVAAYRAAAPQSADAVLVHVGAQNTLIVALAHAQAVFAASFPVGGDTFTRAIAKARRCPIEEAEAFKRDTNTLTGSQAIPEFAELVDGWVAELKRQINDWLAHRPGAPTDLSAFAMVASGTAFDQPGLLEYLNGHDGLPLRAWPVGAGLPAHGFETAYGTALQALGLTAQPVSLLPAARRVAWQQRLTTQRIEFANLALLVLCFLLLALGAWQKVSLVHRQEALLAKVQAGSEMLRDNQAMTAELLVEYEGLRPLLECQQTTRDTLETLALLQQTRSNRAFWYVLVADQHSYFHQPSSTSTNRAGATNTLAGSAAWLPFSSGPFLLNAADVPPSKPGLIAELCVPEDLEGARRVLRQIVNDLKQRPLFNKVDLLSDDLRRDLADPKVILPERHFALSLDFAATEFHQPVPAKKLRSPDSLSKPNRRPAPTSDPAERDEAGKIPLGP